MTKMTVNGVSTTKTPGQEQFETFSRKVGRQTKKYVAYDYRHTDGELFSCTKPTLDACRAARDEWLNAKAEREAEEPDDGMHCDECYRCGFCDPDDVRRCAAGEAVPEC